MANRKERLPVSQGALPPRARQSLGQNFLVDPNQVRKIVDLAGIGPEDTVVELGPGPGALTREIAPRAARVIALEIDPRMVEWLSGLPDLPPQVEVREQDMLKADLCGLAPGIKPIVMGNLPYNISTQLLIRLIDQRHCIRKAVLMFQKEVAQRLTARVGTKEYGTLTVLLDYCATVERLMEISPGSFRPRPRVDSWVVKITFHPPEKEVKNFTLFKKIIKKTFQKRRKKILNALKDVDGIEPIVLKEILTSCSIDEGKRADHLSHFDYASIANKLDELTRK